MQNHREHRRTLAATVGSSFHGTKMYSEDDWFSACMQAKSSAIPNQNQAAAQRPGRLATMAAHLHEMKDHSIYRAADEVRMSTLSPQQTHQNRTGTQTGPWGC